MTETLQIFISGTQDDLQPERQAVAETIRALGHTPLMAETYGAQPMPSYDAIREMIARADIYLGVYGARYGSLKMESGVSVTEFEFTEFRRTRPSRILVYVKDGTPEDEQAAFLDRVQHFKAGYFRRPKFKDAAQLAEWVKEDLAQLIARVVHEKLRGAPDPLLIQEYLAQVAANKPYVLWDDQTYIDRTVKPQDEEIFYPRLAARYDPRAPERDSQPEPLDAVLAREKKLVLLGEPGIGKTTALLHLAWQAARNQVSPRNLVPGEVPIYIELKYYEGGELETLLARRINDMLRPANLMLDADARQSTRILKQWLAQSDTRFLLLLDGLNEVRPEFHTALRGALEALLRTPHHIVISCRERDYDASLRDNAAAFVLQGLQENEIRNYLQRALGDKGEKLFDDQIRWDKKMLTLAANPLMLWLISVVASQDPEARLPTNRGKLFQTFVEQMPRLRRSEVPANVPLDIVETALAKLGFEMLGRGRLAADLGEVRGWQIPTAGEKLDAVLAQAKDWRFLKSDGRFGEPIEFLHQLFQEYFAAIQLNLAIRNSQFAIVLGDRPFKDEWHETIVMLAGICDQPAELVKWLGAQVVEKQKGRVAFLVQRCWETSDAAANDKARATVVDVFIAALRDPGADVRWRAADALGKIGNARAVEPLIAALRDPDAYVRRSAANALWEIGDARVVEPLTAALRDPDAGVRERAAEALGEIKDVRAVEPLSAALRDPDADVREHAAEALGKIGDVRAVEPLIAILHDTAPYVRSSAADALGEIGDARAVEPLIAALRDPDAYVRGRAAVALGEIGDARAVEPLIAALRDPNANVRWRAADALGEIGDARAVEPLIAALRDPYPLLRGNAARTLGKIGDVRAVEPLIAALRDPEAGVRESAADALVKIGPPAVKPLIAALHNRNAGVRSRTADALGEIGDARAVEPLIVALRDPNADVREGVIFALGKIGTSAVVSLIAALSDPEAVVRAGAAEVLGQIGDARATEQLIAALRDPKAVVRKSAAYALGEIKDVRAVEPLIATLRDPNADVRRRAADALVQIGDARAVEPLIAALRDPDKYVRWRAADALGKIGDARALPELERIAREDTGETVWGSVADTAREAIARIRR